MSNVVVVPVANRLQRKAFLTFPWQLYRNDPNWVPPLRSDQKELVGYGHHPFYLRNRVQTFLAYRDNQVCGRIAAILNQDHIDFQHERRGFFGFFECVNDPEAARSLLDAARAWLAEQGMQSIRGPASPSFNHVMGTLVEGFDTPPTFMMAYNPPYYGELIEGCGFRKSQDSIRVLGQRRNVAGQPEQALADCRSDPRAVQYPHPAAQKVAVSARHEGFPLHLQ